MKCIVATITPSLQVVHNLDLRFTIAATAHEAWLDCVIYDIVELENEVIPRWPLKWLIKESHCMTTDIMAEAEVYLHGTVKLDGCSNWYFDEQDRVELHACNRKDLTRFSAVMCQCLNMAKQMLPSYSGD